MGAALALTSADTYVVVTLLPKMLSDLEVPLDRVERALPVVTGFLLGYVVAMPLLGALSDRRGRGPVLLAALGAFALGSALTASAGLAAPGQDWSGLWMLLVGRVLQGAGGGALVPVAMAAVADAFPGPGRRGALGALSGLQEGGSVAGPLYGAGLAQGLAGAGGWRLVFWLNLPLAAIAGALAWRTLREGRGRAADRARAVIDWPGALLLGAALGMLVLALYPDQPADRPVSAWFGPAALAALALAGGFVIREVMARRPLVDLRQLRDPALGGALAANLLAGAGLMVALVDVPIFARAVFDLDQLGSAWLLLRFMVAIPAGAIVGGLLARRAGPAPLVAAGMVLAGAGFAGMSRWVVTSLGDLPSVDGVLLLCGFGFGLVIAPLAGSVLERSAPERHGVTSSLVVLSRTVGMLLGLAGLGSFGLSRFHQLLGLGPALPFDPGSAAFPAETAALDARVRGALVLEYHEIFLVAAVVCLFAALLAALALRWRWDQPAGTSARAAASAVP
ncbi:MAG: MFS transporter [Candidatus Dormibacteria bacterium]